MARKPIRSELGVVNAIGLVGHLLEGSRQPMAAAIWHQVEEHATRHIDKK